MITLRYFASLRDQLGTEQQQLDYQSQFKSVADIKQQLINNNPQWQTLLKQSILCAVNQEMADDNTQVKDGDEIAFFPPVTGG